MAVSQDVPARAATVTPSEPDTAPAAPTPPPAPVLHPWDRALRWLDRRQQRIPPIAFVGAILKKSGEDQVGLLAAVMSHFGMLSVFPLLLLLITIAGYVFHDDAAAQQALIDAALENFPVLGDQLRASVQALPGSGVAIGFGLVLLAWGSLGFTKTAQIAMAEIWAVPRRLRPGYWQQLGRSVWALAMLGLPTIFTAAATIVSGNVAPLEMDSIPGWTQVAVTVASVLLAVTTVVAVTFTSHLLAFRALTPHEVPTKHLLPGTVLFTIFWTGLTIFGSNLLSSRVARANQLYGTIGFVIGLIFWIYLGAYGALLSAEMNAVRSKRLYPRTLVGPPRTRIDRRALRQRARTEELVPGQVVDVRFDGPDAPAPEPALDGKQPEPETEADPVAVSVEQPALDGIVEAAESKRPQRR